MRFPHPLRLAALLLACLCGILPVQAQENLIRKNLQQRLSQMPEINEVRPSAMPGLFEVRINDTDIVYTDAQGNFLIQGKLIDTKARRNLTEERLEKLNAINFMDLPLSDAITLVRGDGQRKMAIFEDPNCGYCKQLERDLQQLNNVTIYLFLYPILAQDSTEKSKAIWCAKDRGRAWTDLMLRDQPVASSAQPCDAAGVLRRNLAFGRKHRINGTPTLVFADNSRMPGAMPLVDIEKTLASIKY